MDLHINTPKMPLIGETILGSGFATVPGGKGANQAVAAARLGGYVEMIGCVGDDIYGTTLISSLLSQKVDTHNIKKISCCSTGIAMVVVCKGDNLIIVDPGANAELSEEMVEAFEKDIKESSLLVVQLEVPLNTVEKAVDIAKKHNVRVLLNPAPAVKLKDELLSKIDIITPNKGECELITGISINNTEDAKKAVEWLNKKGIPQVVVTLGSKGAIYNSCNKIILKPAPDVNVVDTTAAGDSFNGALALAISDGREIDEAIDLANIAGSLAVTKKGAQTSIPYLKDVMEYVEKQKIYKF